MTASIVSAWAGDIRYRTEISSSTRGLAMGSTGINTERGAYSVFYNPGNLAAKENKMQIQALNFQLDTSEMLFGNMSRFRDFNFTSVESLAGASKKSASRWNGGRFSLYPNFTIRSFSLGMLYEVNQSAYTNASDQSTRVRVRNRFAPTAALAFRLLDGVIRIGASVHLLNVGEMDKTFSSGATDYKSSVQTGTGLSKNIGATLTLPIKFLPSFSAVFRDAGSTLFKKGLVSAFGSGELADNRGGTVDLGASATVYFGKNIETRWTADLRDATQRLGAVTTRKFNFGGEISIKRFLHLRGGYSAGHFSAGLGLNGRNGTLDFAVYTDETSNTSTSQQDTRFSIQYTWNLFK